ncbi:MAG TPA: permease prefix domain 1-containing protein, partial [Chthoniobacterales bacterium]|nr:permease prefix domain 1-containing protein [Chthoniobacterales bacterium]
MNSSDPVLEEQIAQWRGYLRRRQSIQETDVEELEGHLRDEAAVLTNAGLAGDEAFLVAVKRLGSQDALSREFALEHSERLWKQLVVGDGGIAPTSRGASRREIYVVLALAVGAALAIKVPVLFGFSFSGTGEFIYARNLSLFVLPFLTAYFVWKRGIEATPAMWLVLPFALAALFANVYPFAPNSHTGVLTVLHLPIALWVVVGFAYVGGWWFKSPRRMDFVRFSGELFIYYVLIALGGGVLTAFTVMMFEAIGLNAEWLAQGWLIPCGAMGAVLVGSWLVEAKQSVIENMAPVLTRLLTPLFTCLLL